MRSRRFPERGCVCKDLKPNQRDPDLPETQAGTRRKPRVSPDSPAGVSGRARPFSGGGQSLSHVRLFSTPWTAARQTCVSSPVSWSLLRFLSIELVMPSSHLILCHPLLLLPSVLPSSGPHMKFQSKNRNITSSVGWSCPAVPL